MKYFIALPLYEDEKVHVIRLSNKSYDTVKEANTAIDAKIHADSQDVGFDVISNYKVIGATITENRTHD